MLDAAGNVKASGCAEIALLPADATIPDALIARPESRPVVPGRGLGACD